MIVLGGVRNRLLLRSHARTGLILMQESAAVSKARGMGFDAKLAWVSKLVLRELVSILNEMANIPNRHSLG